MRTILFSICVGLLVSIVVGFAVVRQHVGEAPKAKEPPNEEVAKAKETPTDGVPKPQEAATGQAHIAPVIYLDSKSNKKLEVHFIFENTSREPFRYCLGHTEDSIAGLGFGLYQDGQILERETHMPPELSADRIREIKPGEGLTCTIKLLSYFVELKPGRYEMRLSYHLNGPVNKFKMTPISSVKQKLYLEIK